MSVVMAGIAPFESLPTAGTAPRILNKLEAGLNVPEGEPIHLDIRVASETEVRIDWLKDGKQLTTGSRVNEAYDRGYASLDIQYTFPEDTGTYSCVVSNCFGSVTADPVDISVIAEEAEQYETVAMQNEAFDAMPSRFSSNEAEVNGFEAPTFKQPITCSQPQVLQGHPSRFVGEVKPANDSSIRIEWLRDGQPIVIGSRFSSLFDRGFVALNIAYCYPEDSGAYTCVAISNAGKVESQSVSLTCEADAKIVTTSNLPETSINHLKQLEDLGNEDGGYKEQTATPIPPSFKSTLIPPKLTVFETCDAYFEVPVDTGNGTQVKVEWKRDGKLVHFSSRINDKLEIGKASLRFGYTQPSDAGQYVCCITTEHGTCESGPAELVIETTGTIISESQLQGDRANTGLIALQELEALLNAPKHVADDDEGPLAAPTIVQQPHSVGTILEGESVDFRLQFEPATDPNVVVQWYKDEKVLSNGTRFLVNHERGIASLTLLHTIAEDSGSYWCKIVNATGSIDSNRLEVICSPSAVIITQSNLLEGSEGYKLIQEIEHGVDGIQTDTRYMEVEDIPSKPIIDVPPQPAEVILGAPIRFLVRMNGFPAPTITWFLDGEEVVQSSLLKVYNDGGISILELNKCDFALGSHKIQLKGVNNQGETGAETELMVHPTDYNLPDLKHVAPENPYRKLAALKKVECTEELNKAFSRAKPTPKTIIDMERDTEWKARNFRSPDVLAAEDMLDKIASGLRKSDISKLVEMPMNGAETTE